MLDYRRRRGRIFLFLATIEHEEGEKNCGNNKREQLLSFHDCPPVCEW
jgi:hypothetical protein